MYTVHYSLCKIQELFGNFGHFFYNKHIRNKIKSNNRQIPNILWVIGSKKVKNELKSNVVIKKCKIWYDKLPVPLAVLSSIETDYSCK